VILGHSERRHIFKEDNEMIHCKLQWALEENIEPILCIGETQEERDQNRTKEVLEAQLGEALKDFSSEEVRKMILAYEPVWAIGTGKTATPEIAQEAHLLCRSFVAEKCGKEAAEVVPILYGGSVKPENIGELIQKPDIDGALIGGASLEVDSFAQIIHNVEETLK
jgi:triosephosphate isomerase